MKKQIKKFNFNIPADAREFLYGLKLAATGQGITGVQRDKIGWKEFVDMTDDEVMDTASELYTDFGINQAIIWEPRSLN